MDMHRIAKAPDDPFGAQPASFFLVRIAAFGDQQLLVVNGHAAAAHPVLTVTRVNMIEIGQRGSPSSGIT